MKPGAAALFGLALSACAIFTRPPPETRVVEAREVEGRAYEEDERRGPRERIQVRVMEIDAEKSDRRRYGEVVRYDAQLSCRSTRREEPLHFAKKGVAEGGDFSLAYPSECRDEAELSVDVLPEYRRCRPERNDKRVSVWPGKQVELDVRCESESYRAKLEALVVLDCRERGADVERAGEHEYWVRGCGRSVRMRCFESEVDHSIECDHGRIHRD